MLRLVVLIEHRIASPTLGPPKTIAPEGILLRFGNCFKELSAL
jgi:hypothetical protein